MEKYKSRRYHSKIKNLQYKKKCNNNLKVKNGNGPIKCFHLLLFCFKMNSIYITQRSIRYACRVDALYF